MNVRPMTQLRNLLLLGGGGAGSLRSPLVCRVVLHVLFPQVVSQVELATGGRTNGTTLNNIKPDVVRKQLRAGGEVCFIWKQVAIFEIHAVSAEVGSSGRLGHSLAFVVPNDALEMQTQTDESPVVTIRKCHAARAVQPRYHTCETAATPDIQDVPAGNV
mmetsp:Transcript_108825/g.347377  ORF Transcript_108825/g.347377 Transcript_108825/m.347377 type:complete len:160 (-) Transcript_108825:339-818(-)